MQKTPVLIVGAGPTGLVLALSLHRQGVKFRIIDQTPGPGTTSRAIVMHARTLEFYQQMGISDPVVKNGVKFKAINLWASGKKRGHASLGDIGEGLSEFPYMLIYPQDEHEAFLVHELKKMGIAVERNTQLRSFKDDGPHVTAIIRNPDGQEEEFSFTYIAGCDGAHSKVREGLNVGFSGATYEQLFYVADVKVKGPLINGELHLAFDGSDFLGVFPLKGDHQARFIGTVIPKDSQKKVTWEDVSNQTMQRLNLSVENVNWFSTYHVHHRLAEHFRKGSVFLLGDAAHIHSPVGGQGMNTGIGDAINLAWKLAGVIKSELKKEVLDTYQKERKAFAEKLVATTDRAFTFVTNQTPAGEWIRTNIVPRILPAILKMKLPRRLFFQTVSQIGIQYHQSSMSQGRLGKIRAGDRLPYLPSTNFKLLDGLTWQLHIYGKSSLEITNTCKKWNILTLNFSWNLGFAKAGFIEDAYYLIRPDGYIATLGRLTEADRLEPFLNNVLVPK